MFITYIIVLRITRFRLWKNFRDTFLIINDHPCFKKRVTIHTILEIQRLFCTKQQCCYQNCGGLYNAISTIFVRHIQSESRLQKNTTIPRDDTRFSKCLITKPLHVQCLWPARDPCLHRWCISIALLSFLSINWPKTLKRTIACPELSMPVLKVR